MKFLNIIFALIVFASTTNAQSTALMSHHYNIEDVTQIDTKSFGKHRVTYKTVKGTRVIVERVITAKHVTSSDALVNMAKKSPKFTEKTVLDNATDTFIIERHEGLEAIAKNSKSSMGFSPADIVVDYTIYVPAHVKILQ